jgi:hypothetical protein
MRLDVGLQEFLGIYVDWDKNGVGFCCNEVSNGNILGLSHNSMLQGLNAPMLPNATKAVVIT